MPKASARTATVVNPGLFQSNRNPNCRSRHRFRMPPPHAPTVSDTGANHGAELSRCIDETKSPLVWFPKGYFDGVFWLREFDGTERVTQSVGDAVHSVASRPTAPSSRRRCWVRGGRGRLPSGSRIHRQGSGYLLR